MERTFRQTNTRYVNSEPDSEEPQYDVVNDLQEELSVQILPARPFSEEQLYADRDAPWSASEQDQKSLLMANSNMSAQHQQNSQGPRVNRDIKPGRRQKALDNRSVLAQTRKQGFHRPCPPPPPSSDETTNNFPDTSPNKVFSRNEREEAVKITGFSPNATGRRRAETVSSFHKTQRHSLELDSDPTEKGSHQNLERVFSKHQHHEWPQTREESELHEFVPKEKLQQTYCGRWYIQACNRTDAEHVLHLVNTDGAFLVRDCSLQTNSEPFVLTVYHDKKVYNIKIRFFESTGKYALGTGQRSKDMFDSVRDIIKFHSIFPISLISGKYVQEKKYPENCLLRYAVTRRDVDQLLQ